MCMRAYCIERAADRGSYPHIRYRESVRVNFGKPTYLEEARREVWGYVEYNDIIPETLLGIYDMVSEFALGREAETSRWAERIANFYECGRENDADIFSDMAVRRGINFKLLNKRIDEMMGW